MMLSKKEVKHIAGLAKLSFAEKEVGKLQKELGTTLDFIEVLEEIDTRGVEPTFHVTGLRDVLRSDMASASLSKKQALSGASAKDGDYFKVKYVFGG